MGDRPFKFGVLNPDEAAAEPNVPFAWDDTFCREPTTGPQRLVIAPAGGATGVMLDLMGELPGPYCVLYVLLLSRRGEHAAGRYESPSLSREELAGFMGDFREFFEGDGRHEIWVSSLGGWREGEPMPPTLVYDQHDVIYAYGPLDDYEARLRERGLSEADSIRFPVPHAHRYNAEYDADESAAVSALAWKFSPLAPQDDAR